MSVVSSCKTEVLIHYFTVWTAVIFIPALTNLPYAIYKPSEALQLGSYRLVTYYTSLHWLPVNFRLYCNVLMHTYRALRPPQYIVDFLHPHTWN